MVRLTRRRTALALYVVLLVLPAVVLGGLHWHQLVLDQRARLAAVPIQVRDAAQRLSESIARDLEELIAAENRRGFEEYRREYFPRHAIGASIVFVPSQVARLQPPEGILAWFRYFLRDGSTAPYELFPDSSVGGEEFQAMERGLRESVAQLIEHDWTDGFFRRITRVSDLRGEPVPLAFAAVNTSPEPDLQCIIGDFARLADRQHEQVQVRHYDFHLRFYREADGTPRLIATRPVRIDGHRALYDMPECFRGLRNGVTIMQGFFIDPGWLFGELPVAAATRVLGGALEFVPAGEPRIEPNDDLEVAAIRLVDVLEIETYEEVDRDYGAFQVVLSTRELRAHFKQQALRFFGVASMLTLTLATGLVLLLRSVTRDLEQAQRTENFVAAVTHELRTPVSAIRLYGEMLRDGWAVQEEKQKEYYRRIVSEAERLETMVERVLEKAQLIGAGSAPQPADLNACVEPVVDGLVQRHGPSPNDLALELTPGLPPVLLTTEALGSILVNLVENARKYAPVKPGGLNGAAEPILVRTANRRGAPVLEVLDRGPGIPVEERARIFEAFYRIGNEARRSSRGTGLGLHLVQAQAQALGGHAEVVDRPGGGSIFRVTFRRASAGQPL